MKVSVQEAAKILGKSERTIRYWIKSGTISAQQQGRMWQIEKESLGAVSPQTHQSIIDQNTAIKQQLIKAIDDSTPKTSKDSGKSYSLLDLQAFQSVARILSLLSKTSDTNETLQSAYQNLVACAHNLADGCHQYHKEFKHSCYISARSHAAWAAADIAILMIVSNEQNDDFHYQEILNLIESEILGSIRGLIRSTEKQKS